MKGLTGLGHVFVANFFLAFGLCIFGLTLLFLLFAMGFLIREEVL